MNIRACKRYLESELSSMYEDEYEAASVSQFLLEARLGLTYGAFLGAEQDPIPPAMLEIIQNDLNRLKEHEPVQYVVGKAYFYGKAFCVSPAVLIPRQETEELMVWVRDQGKLLTYRTTAPLRVVDLGTGSGCIPILLSLEWDKSTIPYEIYGWDLSGEALQIAEKNRRELQATVQFQRKDIFSISSSDLPGPVHIIVSNPPYIPISEAEGISARVKSYEPGQALFVPDEDPLLFYRAIGQFALPSLAPGGYLFVEAHMDFAGQVKRLFEELAFDETELRKDLQGRPRMIMARKKGYLDCT